MDPLIEGYRRFHEHVWPQERARYEALAAQGERPKTLVIACSDSRVDPQTIFGAAPGELFVVRNVGALVPPYQPDAGYHGTSAALEFGVRVLKVSRVVVLGHARCSGVKALVEGLPNEAVDFLKPWMRLAEPAIQPSVEAFEASDVLGHYETEVVLHSLANLRTFPWIREAIEAGALALDGFRFDIHTGMLMRLDGDEFVPVT
jgi:carbonic anhydrase